MNKDKYINIKWQDGVIPENGVNGVQINDVVDVLIDRLSELQNSFPDKFNETTLYHLQKAKQAQNERTHDRTKRGVEGKNEK